MITVQNFQAPGEIWRYQVHCLVYTGLPDNKYLALLITPLQTYLQYTEAQQPTLTASLVPSLPE